MTLRGCCLLIHFAMCSSLITGECGILPRGLLTAVTEVSAIHGDSMVEIIGCLHTKKITKEI